MSFEKPENIEVPASNEHLPEKVNEGRDLSVEWGQHLKEHPWDGTNHNQIFSAFLDKQDGLPKSPDQLLAESKLREVMHGRNNGNGLVEVPAEYEVLENSPESPTDMNEIFKQIDDDLKSFEGNKTELDFKKDDVVELAINSEQAVHYEILDARNGHYFISRLDYPERDPNKLYKGTFLLSHEPRTEENPDLIVCTPEELESWMKK